MNIDFRKVSNRFRLKVYKIFHSNQWSGSLSQDSILSVYAYVHLLIVVASEGIGPPARIGDR